MAQCNSGFPNDIYYATGGGVAGRLRCIYEWPHPGQLHRFNLGNEQRTSPALHPAQPNQTYVEWALSPWEKDKELLERYKEALRKYGKHDYGCNCTMAFSEDGPCDCGLDDVFEEL